MVMAILTPRNERSPVCLSKTDPGGPQRCASDALTRAENASDQLNVARYELFEAQRRLDAAKNPSVPRLPEDFAGETEYAKDMELLRQGGDDLFEYVYANQQMEYAKEKAVTVARDLSLDDSCMDHATPEYRDAVSRFAAIDEDIKLTEMAGDEATPEDRKELEDAAIAMMRTAPDEAIRQQPDTVARVQEAIAASRQQDLESAERAHQNAAELTSVHTPGSAGHDRASARLEKATARRDLVGGLAEAHLPMKDRPSTKAAFQAAQDRWSKAIGSDSTADTTELADSALALWEAAGAAGRVGDDPDKPGRPERVAERVSRYKQRRLDYDGEVSTARTVASNTASKYVTANKEYEREWRWNRDRPSVTSADEIPAVAVLRAERDRREKDAREAAANYVAAEQGRIDFQTEIAQKLGVPEETIARAKKAEQDRLSGMDQLQTWASRYDF